MDTDRSLKGLMRINRGRFRNIFPTPPYVPPNTPTNPPMNIPSGSSIAYTSSNFGNNVINSHFPSDSLHSYYCQLTFDYITRNHKNLFTCFESYKTPLLGNTIVQNVNILPKSAAVKADLVFIPYVCAALTANGDYGDFVLPVCSHFDNNGSDGIIDNSDRHDITADAQTLLTNVVAVGARRDTAEGYTGSTSYGYGMEFFEDCSPEALDPYYPDKDIPKAFGELLSNDGETFTSIVHNQFSKYLTVGEKITIRYTDNPNSWKDTYVTEINELNQIKVSPVLDPITNVVYGWHDVTLGSFFYGQTQSNAVPIVAGKLKIIKLETGADWDTVRAAARATAKRNILGIPELDNTNWDIYRGFGCIDIQSAIDYINNNA